jgi:protein-disulfide isomerase/uncharacterized membrane protein
MRSHFFKSFKAVFLDSALIFAQFSLISNTFLGLNIGMKQTQNKNLLLTIALLCTLAAIGVHAYLTQHFFDLKLGAETGNSFCNINSVINCDSVTASKYASFLGIPMALWGAITNLILLYFIVITKWKMTQDTARSSRYAFLISTFTVLASIVMGTISTFFIGNICLFCVSAYVLSIVIFILLWKAAEDLSFDQIKDDIIAVFSTEKWVLGFVAAIPVIAYAGNLMLLDSHGIADLDKMITEKISYWQAAPAQNFDLSAGLVSQKSAGEPAMTIVEFADFRCPHCKHAIASLHAFADGHPDVKFIFKPFPLDGTCNDAMKGGGDGISCGLAYAVMCADKLQHRGWDAHKYFYDNQESITAAHNLDSNLQDLAKFLGLKIEDLKTCVNSADIQNLVKKTAAEGATAQIPGTPTVFVNNKLLDRGQFLPVLDAAYKSLKK